MKKNVLAVLFILILCSCSKTKEAISKEAGNRLFRRVKTKHNSSIDSLDQVPYVINDPLSTPYYQLIDSLIGYWGVSRKVSPLNSLPYFEELDLGSNYYESRDVVSFKELDSGQIEFTIRFKETENEDNRYSRFIVARADSIPFKSNTNEILLSKYRELKSGVFSDSIYGAIDLFDPYSHLEAFKKDAARHGIDLSYISRSDMELIWEPDSCREFLGYSFKNCDPKKLGIGLRRTDWNERIISDFNEFRISMMWHEFGHTILGLQHLCQGGHIMSGRHQNPKVVENLSECDGEYISTYDLVFDHKDPHKNFQRAVLALFFICFKTLLSNETFFTAKRVYLLVGVLCCLLLPFVVITNYVTIDPVPLDWNNLPLVSQTTQTTNLPTWDWRLVLAQTYCVGVLLMFVRLLYQGYSVGRLIRSAIKHRNAGFTHVQVDQKILPFSFFNYIVYNPNQHSATDLDTILKHEKEHCKQKQSLDVIAVQLFLIFQWFNPFAWLYQKEVAQNIEYAADEATLRGVHSKKEYQYVLLDLVVGRQNLAITNPFYNSLIKNRIFMLNKKKSTSKSLWKILPILPLTVLFVFAFNTQTIAQVKQTKVEQKTNVIVAEINENTTDASLEKKVQFFKEKGIELAFKRIKRNQAGEIISIKASYENGTGSKGQYAVNGTDPISPFNLRVELDGDDIIRVDFQGNAPVPPAPPAPHKISKKHKKVKHLKAPKATKAPKANVKVKANIVVDGDDEDVHTTNIHIDGDNDWETLIEGMDLKGEINFDFEELLTTLAEMGDSLELKFKDLDIEGLAESFEINLDSIISNSIVVTDFQVDDENLHKRKMKRKDKNKNKQVFVFKSNEDSDPIILKDGKEIDAIEDLSGDEIESITILKAKEAIEKYGSKGVHGVIEIKGKKKDQH